MACVLCKDSLLWRKGPRNSRIQIACSVTPCVALDAGWFYHGYISSSLPADQGIFNHVEHSSGCFGSTTKWRPKCGSRGPSAKHLISYILPSDSGLLAKSYSVFGTIAGQVQGQTSSGSAYLPLSIEGLPMDRSTRQHSGRNHTTHVKPSQHHYSLMLVAVSFLI